MPPDPYLSLTNAQWQSLFASVQQKLDSRPSSSGQGHERYGKEVDFTSRKAMAGLIDHTLLTVGVAEEMVDKVCEEAAGKGFKTVCVRPTHVARCVSNLTRLPPSSPAVGVTSVIGFHEGTYSTEEKVAETHSAVTSGATELDLVLNHALLRTGAFQAVYADIRAVRLASYSPPAKHGQPQPQPSSSSQKPTPSSDAPASGAGFEPCAVTNPAFYSPSIQTTITTTTAPVLKVILETVLLTPTQILAAVVIAERAGVDFVKTSTGFVKPPGAEGGGGATVEGVGLMRGVCDVLYDTPVAEFGMEGNGGEIGAGEGVGQGGRETGGKKRVKVKASGGIRTLADLRRMVEAGAERVGCSASVGIVGEVGSKGGKGADGVGAEGLGTGGGGGY